MAVYYFFKQNLLASLSIQLEIVAFDVINMFNRQASFEGLCFYFSIFQSYMKAFLVKFKTVFFLGSTQYQPQFVALKNIFDDLFIFEGLMK